MLKQIATALIVASFSVPPAVAFAQNGAPPAPGAAPPRWSDHGPMRQVRGQLENIRQQERDKVLAALTPAHRQLLANVAGQMAVSQSPDPRAAAAQLDAALTPGEKDTILAAHRDAISQIHAIFQQYMQSQQQSGEMKPRRIEHRAPRQLTAGDIVLMVSHAGPPPFAHPHG
jgi:hypothetical protein